MKNLLCINKYIILKIIISIFLIITLLCISISIYNTILIENERQHFESNINNSYIICNHTSILNNQRLTLINIINIFGLIILICYLIILIKYIGKKSEKIVPTEFPTMFGILFAGMCNYVSSMGSIYILVYNNKYRYCFNSGAYANISHILICIINIYVSLIGSIFILSCYLHNRNIIDYYNNKNNNKNNNNNNNNNNYIMSIV